ncbi:excinuclease ABC subunit UvrC, partial [Candidatus Falkowbacteria bacterium]|nr:excinuclease ABC subunit UvrC [Candidatus Falkowbacteria bacterium]
MLTQTQKKVNTIPQKPGVYIYKDKKNTILYVGKAKNLKKRVSSYFIKAKPRTDPRSGSGAWAPDKLIMLSQIHDIDYIITDSEAEALLLESTLIKKHQPRFNIILKDDKNYLYIKINLKEEPARSSSSDSESLSGWPTLTTIRRPNLKDKNFYAGPYPSADSARQTIKLLARIFKFCTCKNFQKKPCLRFRLGWCVCPAETKISKKDYQAIFDKVIKFLKGQTGEVLRELKTEMKKASIEKKYEDAARFRDSIKAIERTVSHQKVISTKNENYDVISTARTSPPVLGGDTRGGNLAAINLFQIREGKLTNKQNFILEHTKNSTESDIIESFITQHYPITQDMPKEIIIPVEVSSGLPAEARRAKAGKKRQLIKLGEKNARNYLNHYFSIQTGKTSNNEKILSELKSVLRLPSSPIRIEAYDISNIQGQNATGSMIVFTNGQPDKSQYRKFDLSKNKSPRRMTGSVLLQTGPNDVAMMAEIVSRRLKNKNWPKPDLIVLDGGKPQLNAVLKVIRYKLYVISLAKKEEEIFLPNRKKPIILPKTSSALQLLQRVRDEAHRFARAYYLKRHQKSQTHSALDDIPGLGPKTKKKLLQKFGSIKSVRDAPNKELEKLISKKIIKKIK